VVAVEPVDNGLKQRQRGIGLQGVVECLWHRF
jgi:hypothetical protein